jgi:ATP-binding cassette, subfamily B, bacterial
LNPTADGPPSKAQPSAIAGFVEQWRARLRELRNLSTVLRIIWQASPGFATAWLVVRVAGSLLPLALLAVSKVIIDGVTAVATGKQLPDNFWYWIAAEIFLAILAATLGRANWYFDTTLGARLSHDLSIRVMEHAATLDLTAYEDPAFYDKLEHARHQATDRATMVSTLGMGIQQTITAASLCIGIVWFSAWILLLLTLSLIPAIVGESHYAFLGYSLATRQTPGRRRLDYLRLLGASKESAKELKLFSLAGYLASEFRDLSEQLFQESRQFWGRRFVMGAVLSLFAISGYYAAYVAAVWRAVHGMISVGTLTFLTGSIAGATSSLQALFSTFSNIADQTLFLKALTDFFQMRPALPVPPNPKPVPRPIREGFRFENVSFSYPGTARPVLHNFNFHISTGERVALVGENGQGKTTIIKLLTRLYDPTSGRILLDGVDLREYDQQSLFRESSVLFQDFMQYDMEARNNIAVGRIDLTGPERDSLIAAAAERSGASEVIERLPAKMDQMLGRRFSGGVDLSGGEWQKIALARAYLRDAQIYVLDEPTASLDARSEMEVFERFADLTKGKMALLISHRFSTVKMADRIVVLKDGRIFEQGSHSELMARGGLYASMFELQAASYR